MNHPTDRQLEIAAFRHRLLAAALDAEEGGVSALLKEAAGRPHRNPDKVLVQVALSTLWKWLAAYRRGGLIALCPHPRKDRGVLRAFPPTLLEAAIRLRQENPQRSSTTIIDIMEREELVAVGAVARSTLDGHLDRQDLSHRRLGTLAKKTFRRIRADAPFELVVADFHHGPQVRTGEDGTTRHAIQGSRRKCAGRRASGCGSEGCFFDPFPRCQTSNLPSPPWRATPAEVPGEGCPQRAQRTRPPLALHRSHLPTRPLEPSRFPRPGTSSARLPGRTGSFRGAACACR